MDGGNMKISRQYSGHESLAFWQLIHSIKDEDIKTRSYERACDLQALENELLNYIESFELHKN